MPDLSFQIAGAGAVPFSASPLLALRLRLENASQNELIQGVSLRCQVQIFPDRRGYRESEASALSELFTPGRFGEAKPPLLWSITALQVPAFQEETEVELHLPCTYDLNLAWAKYLHALSDKEIPLNILFSGAVFYRDILNISQIAPIPWHKEARFGLPVRVFREALESYYPNSAGLLLHRDTFEKLRGYQLARGLPTLEEALRALLPKEG